MKLRPTLAIPVLLGLIAPALAQPDPAAPPPAPAPGEPAPPPANPPTPNPPTETPTAPPVMVAPPQPEGPPKDKKDEKKDDKKPLTNKFEVSLYGFVEADVIYDTTQGLNDLAGSSNIAKKGTYAGDHGQTQFGARNSRFGFKIGAPKYNGIKASAQLEMDFLGNQPGKPFDATGLVSEQAFWQNPGLRYRHMNVKLETHYLDILIGQSWQLFGWQTMAHPNTVAIQGVPGQVYSRSPQIRLSKKIESGDVAVELALAASRPPERASATPDGQAGVRVIYNGIKALHTAGSTGTSLDGLGIGVSAVGRRFAVAEFAAAPAKAVHKNGYGLSIDALIPIIPATKDKHDNALTLTASYVIGGGIADLYQSLNPGVANPSLPNPMGTTPAPAYTNNVDGGLVLFVPDSSDPSGFSLHPVRWSSYIVGLQYYLPTPTKVWLAANYSHMHSPNTASFGSTPAKIWNTEDWADGNLFVDLTPAVRLGGEFSWTRQKYLDGMNGKDLRGQFSALFLF